MPARTSSLQSHIRIVLLLLAALLACWAAAHPSTASADDQPVKITIKTTDSGFDPESVEVEQGKTVELTFVWAHQTHPNEEHVIVMPSYKLESDKISATNTQTTLKFVATQPGTFTFKCDIECDLHDILQHGTLTVKSASGASGGTAASASALQQATLSVDPVNGVLIKGGTVVVSVALQDKDGQAVPKAEVAFYTQREFLGRSGLVQIGTAKTSAAGLATLVYHPATTDPEHLVLKFAGSGLYDATEQSLDIVGSRQFAPAERPATVDLEGLKGWAPVALVCVIAAVWLTFAFVLFQAWRISRQGESGGEAPR